MGELLEFDDIGSILEALDEVEGFLGWGQDGSIFRRALLGAELAGGETRLAWCYLWNGPPPDAPRIASGDWRERAPE